MKRMINMTLGSAFAMMATLGAVGCSSQNDALESIDNETPVKHTCTLRLKSDKPAFEDESTRSITTWAKDDKIYLTFTVGKNQVPGDAVYDGTKWTVTYYGTINDGEGLACKAVYFEGSAELGNTLVTINETTAIYEDASAIYTMEADELTVSAALTPKTTRIRFAGTKGDKITVPGLSHYTGYDMATGTYYSSASAISTEVGETHTPYLYTFFAEGQTRRINVITKNSGFNRIMPGNVMNAGESGFLTVPTTASYAGWQNNVVINANGVDFTMIPVENGKTTYFLAETETTYELYYKVLGNTYTSSMGYRPFMDYYSTWESFIKNLSTLTGLKFRIPTASEWKYAANGGNKSKDYVYSGSNEINEVAWYKTNSGNNSQNVKGKKPNELGFYDMTGNATEWVLYGSIVDYTDKYLYAGGGYNSDATTCALSNALSVLNGGSSNHGLRLAM